MRVKRGMFLYGFDAAAVRGNLVWGDVGGLVRGKKWGEWWGLLG